jgi:hypothetical protein
MKTFASLLAVAGAVLGPATAAAQSLGDCACDDVREIRDRYCSARAARSEYERLESYFKSQKATTGETRMYSLADKKMINQKCVQEAINRVSDHGVVKATAQTEENMPTQTLFGMEECRINVTNEGSACLKQIVQAHEGVHREACLWRKQFLDSGYGKILAQLNIANALGLHYTGDTKYLLASSEFAFEEAISYAMEMQLIAAKWQELQQRCIAKAFEAELSSKDTAGEQLWNSSQEVNGKRIYKMYDLSNDPCPSHPPPPKSECTFK